MASELWTWDEPTLPGIAGALAAPAADWCNRLETAAGDAIVGKVLCVCAAAAITQAVLSTDGDTPQATNALRLLDRWIDDPADERFAEICALISGGADPDLGPHGVGWWALRTATSSVGNFEAGWALASTCGGGRNGGVQPRRPAPDCRACRAGSAQVGQMAAPSGGGRRLLPSGPG